jgi:DNA-binding NarL/FixJ family response regulator
MHIERSDIRIILADDHALFRLVLVEILASCPGMKVVAEASNADEVLDAVERVGADLLILDIGMPGATGTSLVRATHQAAPALPILVLSMHDEATVVRAALHDGARGYLTKDIALDDLEAAILAVAKGGRFLSHNLSLLLQDRAGEPDRDAMETLSNREMQVLRLLLGEGLSLVQIAEQLDISAKTVTTHKANIMMKLGVSSNAELMRYVFSRSPLDVPVARN